MQRRHFLHGALGVATAAALPRLGRTFPVTPLSDAASFSTQDARWKAAYEKALSILAGNVQVLPHFPHPVLIEGSSYAGIWQECGPHESLVYRRFRPDVARNSHTVFFELQHPKGQLPANNKRAETGFGQIQMVVPIAATAWELAQATRDEALLASAYTACSRWDQWLMRYRNTRGTGLVEGFCTYDTGMDHSPRWSGMPVQCPGKDAAVCPKAPGLPRLCPDLSATVYGARVALAKMAQALGRQSEAAQWQEQAEHIRLSILKQLYVPEDGAFYDLDANNHFVKVRSDILTRVCGEHVLDQPTFDAVWSKQLGNPAAFWAPFPLPSVALDDPSFVRPIPRNSWGGAAQALTALRAGRWMEHYGRAAEFAHMMLQWCRALQRDTSYRQQLDPLTGEFTQEDLPNYSPACLVMVDYTWRLAGIVEEQEEIQWNVHPSVMASGNASFRLKTRHAVAEMHYTEEGARLVYDGKLIAALHGEARLITDGKARPLALLGTSSSTQEVTLTTSTINAKRQHHQLAPNQRILL